MRIQRVEIEQQSYFVVRIDAEQARVLTAAPWAGGVETEQVIDLRHTKRLPPVTPSKIVCVGRNYAAHAKELGNSVPTEPLLFLKPPSALCAHGEPIKLPAASSRVEHEAEIGIVIGAQLKDVSPEEAAKGIFGVTCINDVTARDLQKKDVQFTRAKSFDSFCPVGPDIVTGLDIRNLSVICRVNGEQRQQGHTRDMVFPIAELISFISTVMTLEPGDLISTGTPEGVTPLHRGDVVEIEVSGVGVLSNPVG